MTDLWEGADVRWHGPERARQAVGLGEGERLTVVDPGPHHLRSFGALSRGRRSLLSRVRRDQVVVRRADGTDVLVDPDHLELVAPDHPLQPEADGTHARWWLEQLDDWDHAITVGGFVPRSLPAVCTVLHPWTADDRDLTWQAVADQAGLDGSAALARQLVDIQTAAAEPPVTGLAEPLAGQLESRLAVSLVDVLSGATTTPDDVFVAVWEGWGDSPPARFPGAAHLEIPWRGHFLLRGPLHGVQTSVSAISWDTTPASGVWWPADRAWLLHTEIDFHWTFVAGTPQLIDALCDSPDLECIRTHHDAQGNTLPN